MDFKRKQKQGNKWVMDIRKPAHNSTFADMAGLLAIGTFCFYY
jgi:hypothetical protein